MSGEAARLRAAADAESDHDGVRAVLDEALARIKALEAENARLTAEVERLRSESVSRCEGLKPKQWVDPEWGEPTTDAAEVLAAVQAGTRVQVNNADYGDPDGWMLAPHQTALSVGIWLGRGCSFRTETRPTRPTEETR